MPGLATYQQSGPSAPQTARAVLAELPGQVKGFGDTPAYFVTAPTGANNGIRFQARASGVGGESISVAIVANAIAQLAAPTGVGVTPVVGGGTFAAASYFWKVTALNAEGETIGSTEATAAIALNGSATVTWTARTGATGYKIYRSATTGTENVSPALVGTVGAVVTFTDTGAVAAAGAVPAVNTADTGEQQNVTVTTVANAITVNCPVDESGAPDATARAVIDAINLDVNASALIAAASSEGDASGIVAALSVTNLAGDALASGGVIGDAPLPSQHPNSNSYA